jgi:hypothetical protein
VAFFETTEAGETNLPTWLEFHQANRTFLGVPAPTDVGQTYISVMALGEAQAVKDNVTKSHADNLTLPWSSSLAKDVFSITVRESIDAPSAYALKGGAMIRQTLNG